MSFHNTGCLRYNIVGDGTPQALIPILTGKTELELPDTRKRFSHTDFVNVYPFIWKDFKQVGYATAYLEDVPETGVFTYRLKGFHVNYTLYKNNYATYRIFRNNQQIIT